MPVVAPVTAVARRTSAREHRTKDVRAVRAIPAQAGNVEAGRPVQRSAGKTKQKTVGGTQSPGHAPGESRAVCVRIPIACMSSTRSICEPGRGNPVAIQTTIDRPKRSGRAGLRTLRDGARLNAPSLRNTAPATTRRPPSPRRRPRELRDAMTRRATLEARSDTRDSTGAGCSKDAVRRSRSRVRAPRAPHREPRRHA